MTARLVPKDLNFLQNLNRIKVAEDILAWVNFNGTLMKCIVAGDETGDDVVDMHTGQQVLERCLSTEEKLEKPD